MLESKHDIVEYKKMVFGKSHIKREITDFDINASLEIENELIALCKKRNTPIIPNVPTNKRVELIKKIMQKKYQGEF
tara:strand:+ start:117 stop:347 length:231 start_codon:yes stop_codon:yes gene_type:complete